LGRRHRLVLLAALAMSTIACDRWTKDIAVRQLAGASRRSFLSDTLRLDYVENSGAFLSLGGKLPEAVRRPLLVWGTAAILVGVSMLMARQAMSLGWSSLGLCLVWAGGASNLVDRALRGRVIDFMNLGIGPVRTGIFNVADVAIMLGAVLLILANMARTRGVAQQGDEADKA
jgi:signal peptidase II